MNKEDKAVEVTVTRFDMDFINLVEMMVKIALAAIPAMIILALGGTLLAYTVLALLGN